MKPKTPISPPSREALTKKELNLRAEWPGFPESNRELHDYVTSYFDRPASVRRTIVLLHADAYLASSDFPPQVGAHFKELLQNMMAEDKGSDENSI